VTSDTPAMTGYALNEIMKSINLNTGRIFDTIQDGTKEMIKKINDKAAEQNIILNVENGKIINELAQSKKEMVEKANEIKLEIEIEGQK
jgi:hypothetical protein